MRPVFRLAVVLGLPAVLAFASAARPQDGPFGGLQPHYWPHRTFGIPVNTDQIAKLENKPTHLQLYYSASRGAFQKGSKLPVGGMNELNSGKRGFLFEAPRDGDYEFAVQFVYANGEVSPKTESLAPEVRAVCAAHGVEYKTDSWGGTLKKVFRRLVDLSAKDPAKGLFARARNQLHDVA